MVPRAWPYHPERFRSYSKGETMSEVKSIVYLMIVTIIVGLMLRFGRTSVPLARDVEQTVTSLAETLTLKGSGYPYYAPESPKGK
jgi:hypothetical protein